MCLKGRYSIDAFIPNTGDGTIAVIDMKTYKVIKRIPTGMEPHEMVFVAVKNIM